MAVAFLCAQPLSLSAVGMCKTQRVWAAAFSCRCGTVVRRKSVLRSASKAQRRFFELDDEFLCYYQNTKSAK